MIKPSLSTICSTPQIRTKHFTLEDMHQLSFQKDWQFDWTALLDLKTLYELENFDIREYQPECRDHSFIIFFSIVHRDIGQSIYLHLISRFQFIASGYLVWVRFCNKFLVTGLIVFKIDLVQIFKVFLEVTRLFRSSELWAH